MLTLLLLFLQSVSENPLAQPQKSVSTQHRERGPAFPGQCPRVSTLIFPARPASRGLFQVHSHFYFKVIVFDLLILNLLWRVWISDGPGNSFYLINGRKKLKLLDDSKSINKDKEVVDGV